MNMISCGWFVACVCGTPEVSRRFGMKKKRLISAADGAERSCGAYTTAQGCVVKERA